MISAPKHEPFIAPETKMLEFTARSVITGAILGMVFGASSLYLVLKVGITVSASIPVAVISLALFRGLSKLGLRDSTILEHNITQTAGSAGESLAFGIGVTMPAILILGFDLELTRVMLVALLGGLLGILMMIPLRRALIVKEHGTLKYPEGTACAAVLKAGANADDLASASPSARAEMAGADGHSGAAGANVIFTGFGVGLVYTALNVAFKGWKDISQKVFGPPFKSGSVSVEVSPALLGVGYVIGPRIASIMCAGGVLSYLLLIPMIKFFGEHLSEPLAPSKKLIADMSPGAIRYEYVLYIGAGAVAAGGIFSLIQSLPTIWHGLKEGLRGLGNRGGDATTANGDAMPRTERDMSMKFVAIGVVVLIAVITLAPTLQMNLLGAFLIVLFGFLFVTVSSRLTGEIGSSSNPISGMTVATLLFTCLIFLAMKWTTSGYYVTALSVGAIVCIAASNGGTTSQDLKTGYLLGATPKFQQWAIIAGAALSAICLGPILLALNNSATVYVPIKEVAPIGLHTDVKKLDHTERLAGPQGRDDTNTYHVWQKTDEGDVPTGRYLVNDAGDAVWFVDPGINGTHTTRPDGSTVRKFDAPKATLMSYIIQGILNRKLPWALVLLGVMIAVTLELSFVPALAFAVGVYLPLSSSSPIFIGGLVRWLVDRSARKQLRYATMSGAQFAEESDKSPGVLLSSGYIAGSAIAGIVIAILAGALDRVWPSVAAKIEHFDTRLTTWSTAHNPFFDGPWSDALTLIPFVAICLFLYLVGREKFLSTRTAASK
jgi:putative OPT family oligopeptide transporter